MDIVNLLGATLELCIMTALVSLGLYLIGDLKNE